MLSVDATASNEVARQAYEDLFNEYQLRLTNAPTANLRSRYLDRLRELDEARDVLLADQTSADSFDLPTDHPSFQKDADPAAVTKRVPTLAVSEQETRLPPATLPRNETLPRRRRLWPAGIAVAVLVLGLAAAGFLYQSRRANSQPGTNRLQLSLVARDSTNGVGPPLNAYGDSTKTYRIERDLTSPGDIVGFSAASDGSGQPAIALELTPIAVARINSGGILDRQIALVLDGRTVLSSAVMQSEISTHLELTGNFSRDDVARLVGALSRGAD